MATKMHCKEIKVKDFDILEIKHILAQGDNASIQDKIAAHYLLEEIVGGLKALDSELKESIEHTDLSDITKELLDKGLISSESDNPVFVIGERFKVKLSQKEERNFDINTKGLSDIADIIPDKYKKVQVSYDKKAFEAAYNDDTLEPMFKPLVSLKPETVTKMTKSIVKTEASDDAA